MVTCSSTRANFDRLRVVNYEPCLDIDSGSSPLGDKLSKKLNCVCLRLVGVDHGKDGVPRNLLRLPSAIEKVDHSGQHVFSKHIAKEEEKHLVHLVLDSFLIVRGVGESLAGVKNEDVRSRHFGLSYFFELR